MSRGHRDRISSWLAVAVVGAAVGGCGATHTSTPPGPRPAGAGAGLAIASTSAPARPRPADPPARPEASAGSAAGSPTSATGSTPGSAAGSTSGSTGALAGKTVVIDPGHNGDNYQHTSFINHLVPAGRGREKPCNTTGTATAAGYSEAAFNYSVATDLRPILVGEGARVVMTRHSNNGVGPCVNRRAAIGNAVHADAVIAIHADGGPPGGRGFQVIYPPDVGDTAPIYAASLRLAHNIHASLVASRLLPPSTYVGTNGYSLRSDLAGLNLSTRPAIFVEFGNMNNPVEARLQTQSSFREDLAHTLAEGLAHFLTRA